MHLKGQPLLKDELLGNMFICLSAIEQRKIANKNGNELISLDICLRLGERAMKFV